MMSIFSLLILEGVYMTLYSFESAYRIVHIKKGNLLYLNYCSVKKLQKFHEYALQSGG